MNMTDYFGVMNSERLIGLEEGREEGKEEEKVRVAKRMKSHPYLLMKLFK